MNILLNSVDTVEMLHIATFSSGPTLFTKSKLIFRDRNIIFFNICNEPILTSAYQTVCYTKSFKICCQYSFKAPQ